MRRHIYSKRCWQTSLMYPRYVQWKTSQRLTVRSHTVSGRSSAYCHLVLPSPVCRRLVTHTVYALYLPVDTTAGIAAVNLFFNWFNELVTWYLINKIRHIFLSSATSTQFVFINLPNYIQIYFDIVFPPSFLPTWWSVSLQQWKNKTVERLSRFISSCSIYSALPIRPFVIS